MVAGSNPHDRYDFDDIPGTIFRVRLEPQHVRKHSFCTRSALTNGSHQRLLGSLTNDKRASVRCMAATSLYRLVTLESDLLPEIIACLLSALSHFGLGLLCEAKNADGFDSDPPVLVPKSSIKHVEIAEFRAETAGRCATCCRWRLRGRKSKAVSAK